LPYVERAARAGRVPHGETCEAIAQRGAAFILNDGSADVLGYTIEANGDEVFITAASGAAKFDLIDAILEIVEAQAAGFKSVGFRTVRRGLVKKAQKNGYQIAGYIMRKAL
jgi:hypothetical protein